MIDFLKASRRAVVASLFAFATAVSTANAAEFDRAWRDQNSAIVLDAYEHTPIRWLELPDNQRLAAFINKASDGLAPKYRCRGEKACRANWRRYSATKELYHTRRALALTQGLKWGAYHLARPGNPIQQAEHFLSYTKPGPDDLLALDIEHDDPRKWMSLEDGEIFAKHIKMRTGRWPILYTNHYTSRAIAARKDELPILSRLNLWYARYKEDIRGVFPLGHWDSYTIWQFSSMVNCNDRTCPMRIKGTGNWIDVNVAAMGPAELKAKWPFAELTAGEPPEGGPVIVAADGTVTDVRRSSLIRYSGGVPLLRSTFEEPKVQVAAVKVKKPAPAVQAAEVETPAVVVAEPDTPKQTTKADVEPTPVKLPDATVEVAVASVATPRARPTSKSSGGAKDVTEQKVAKAVTSPVSAGYYVAAYSHYTEEPRSTPALKAIQANLVVDAKGTIPASRMNRDVTVPTTRELGLRTRYDDEDREYTPAEVVAWKRFLRRQAALRDATKGS